MAKTRADRHRREQAARMRARAALLDAAPPEDTEHAAPDEDAADAESEEDER